MGRSTYDNGLAERADKGKHYQEINQKMLYLLADFGRVFVAVGAAMLNTAVEQQPTISINSLSSNSYEMHIQHNEY